MIVLDTDDIKVSFNNKKVKITIINFNKYKNFWKTTIKNIKNVEQKKNANMDTVLSFKAGKCHTLKELLKIKSNNLSYRHAEYLFTIIGEQLKNLEKDNYSLFELDLDDIIIVVYGDGWANVSLLYLNTDKFKKIDEKGNIVINKPFKKTNNFLSPEVKSISEIPAVFNKNCWIYSVGYMISYCLNNDVLKKNSKDDIGELLKELDTTKLYYAVMRCLEFEPNKRYYLYI